MKRSKLVVLFVGFLTIQGSVAGVLVQDGGPQTVENNATDTEPNFSSLVQVNNSTAADNGSPDSSNVVNLTNFISAASSSLASTTEEQNPQSNNSSNRAETEEATTQAPAESERTASESQTGSDPQGSSATSTGSSSTSGSPTPDTTEQSSAQAAATGTTTEAPDGSPTASPDNTGQDSDGSSGAASGSQQSGAGTDAGSGTQTDADQSATSESPPAGGATSGAGASPSSAASGGGNAQAISPDAEFSVDNIDSDISVGETGTVSVTITNTGEDATDAVVNLRSLSGGLVFGQSATTSRFIGDWDEGESRTIEVSVQAAPTSDTSEYPIQATVSYQDEDGDAARSAPQTFGVAPEETTSDLAVDSVTSDVKVGGTGTVSITLENTGEDANDAVINLQSLSGDLLFGQTPDTSRFIGEWEAGTTKTIEVSMRATPTADTSEYPVRATVSYQNDDDNSAQIGPVTVGVDTGDEQSFSLENVDSNLAAGESGTISGSITNEGPETATDAVVTVSPNATPNILPRQSQIVLGTLEPGDSESFEVPVVVESRAEPGLRQLPLTVQYYDSDGNPFRSKTLTTQVDISEENDEFQVVETNSQVQIGDEGPISVTLENTGENASEATVTLQSLTPDIRFGRTGNATQFVGDWPAGTERTVSINATASNTTDLRDYPFRTSVSYEDPDGDQARGGSFTFGVTPQPEQTFDISEANSTLRVGDEGNVTATIVNEGPQDVQNAVIRLVTQGQNLNLQETEYSVGDIGAGEAVNASFPIEITDSAEAGQRQFSFVVEYDNTNNNPRRSGTLDAQVTIDSERDGFTVEPQNAAVSSGSSETVSLSVTNNRDTAVRNINAKVFADAPLSLASDEAYISRLGPGETKRITFETSASGDAREGQYPLTVDFQYDTASGDSKLSQTYDVPVEVTSSGDDGFLSLVSVVGIIGVLIALIGFGWVRSRQ